MSNATGRIIKGVGGLYTVKTADSLVVCSPRGIFRKTGQTLLAGDLVEIAQIDNESFRIESVFERKNSLFRPPVANIDQLIIVASVLSPSFNPALVDIMTVFARHSDIEPIIIISKSDLASTASTEKTYKNAGFTCLSTSEHDPLGAKRLGEVLRGKISAFCGNSGVGKTSLLNLLHPDIEEKTAEISKKLGRGRHTTRVSELFMLDDDTFIIDTPGFSSIDIKLLSSMQKEDLAGCFFDFNDFSPSCKFNNCAHIGEIDCGIKRATENGEIERSRYESYAMIYKDLSEKVLW